MQARETATASDRAAENAAVVRRWGLLMNTRIPIKTHNAQRIKDKVLATILDDQSRRA